ncbi:MAG: hypothetical protein LOY01_09415, partial [Brachybacterium paraconglomeratum]|nr:hypothetical protein [Brachybacterium paraconglomeratum]
MTEEHGTAAPANDSAAPDAAPVNPYRGVPLRERDAMLRRQVLDLGDEVDVAQVLAAWERALD